MTREELIKLAEIAKEKKMAPLEVYVIDTDTSMFLVSLNNRPPKSFAGGKPIDMDIVFEVKK